MARGRWLGLGVLLVLWASFSYGAGSGIRLAIRSGTERVEGREYIFLEVRNDGDASALALTAYLSADGRRRVLGTLPGLEPGARHVFRSLVSGAVIAAGRERIFPMQIAFLDALGDEHLSLALARWSPPGASVPRIRIRLSEAGTRGDRLRVWTEVENLTAKGMKLNLESYTDDWTSVEGGPANLLLGPGAARRIPLTLHMLRPDVSRSVSLYLVAQAVGPERDGSVIGQRTFVYTAAPSLFERLFSDPAKTLFAVWPLLAGLVTAVALGIRAQRRRASSRQSVG